MKQCHVWITLTLGMPQIQSCIKSINDGGTIFFFALDHRNYAILTLRLHMRHEFCVPASNKIMYR